MTKVPPPVSPLWRNRLLDIIEIGLSSRLPLIRLVKCEIVMGLMFPMMDEMVVSSPFSWVFRNLICPKSTQSTVPYSRLPCDHQSDKAV